MCPDQTLLLHSHASRRSERNVRSHRPQRPLPLLSLIGQVARDWPMLDEGVLRVEARLGDFAEDLQT